LVGREFCVEIVLGIGVLLTLTGLWGFLVAYFHDRSITCYPSLHELTRYWLPLTENQRAHNRRRSIECEIQEHTRQISICEKLANEYRREGDEISAVVLLAQADATASRQEVLEVCLRDFEREMALARREPAFDRLMKRS
jgi:hypothetical protein